MNLSAIVDLAGLAASFILYLLIGLSTLQLAILVERAIVFLRSRPRRGALREVRRALDQGRVSDAEEALGARRRPPRSLEERVIAAGLARAADGADTADEVMRAELGARRLELESRLPFLATLGNNAPFIGLLGTVLGIMHAFANLSATSGQVSTEVMSGISEALVSTGVGLFVAIPAVIAFNWFQRIIKRRVVAAEGLVGLLLAALRSQRRRASGRLAVVEQPGVAA